MTIPDFRGARGANTGDDFHELWTLRTALMLLDQDTALRAITVEGLRIEDERGAHTDAWNGVDCTCYFDGDDNVSAGSLDIVQCKYSAANPDAEWTCARLAASSNTRGDNSVIGRLAQAFTGVQQQRPDLVAQGRLAIRFISNQPVAPTVLDALASHPTAPHPDRRTLQIASGLSDGAFADFARCLDLSQRGHDSRFALEEDILTWIAEWTDDDARTATDYLKGHVHRKMLPEAKGEIITRLTVLSWLGVSYPEALFPCPTAISPIDLRVPRAVSSTVVEYLRHGTQRLCLHGGGGCGKTTALQEIVSLLPIGSVEVIFDCYGGGTYLDTDAYRHRPHDAFLHLINDLARKFRLPLLVSQAHAHDYPRLFARRLRQAAALLAARSADALLVIVVDAADNAVTAAELRSEQSFLPDLCALGNLHPNVRLIVTARTGRLSSLALPRLFVDVPMPAFTREETAVSVRGTWPDIPDTWIDDFHALSDGNPRVQQYAREFAQGEPAHALNYLRPHGKELTQVFREQFARALQTQDLSAFCAGIIALPRPIPLADLSTITGLSEASLRDLAADLAPGIRVLSAGVSFADEDFEAFVRTEAESQLVTTYARIAEHFSKRHLVDAYAATHLATALLAAGHRQAIIDLVARGEEPKSIGDPVLRRTVYLERLHIAMRVCREAGNTVDGILTLLSGAEASKTGELIRSVLRDNLDLAASFAHETVRRVVLNDPSAYAHHGPLLFHLLAVDARAADGIAVREGFRRLDAWMERRNEHLHAGQDEHLGISGHEWRIDVDQVAAEIEAVLRIAGSRAAYARLQQWRPASFRLHVASLLAVKLIASGETALLQRCLTEASIPAPWDIFLLVPLALSGAAIDVTRLEVSLVRLLRYPIINLERVRFVAEHPTDALQLDEILTACELLFACGGDHASVIPVLEQIADPAYRRRDRLHTSQPWLIDFSLRAHALLARLGGQAPSVDSFVVAPPDPIEAMTAQQQNQRRRQDEEKRKELAAVIGPLIGLYDIRAQALLGQIAPGEIPNLLSQEITHYQEMAYRYETRFYASELQTRTASAITRLMVIPGITRTELFECARTILGRRSDAATSAWSSIYSTLALDQELHTQIIDAIATHAAAVRRMRVSADEKIAALLGFARMLLPISRDDARSLFTEAIEVAGEVNEEAIHEITLLAPLTSRAVNHLHPDARRTLACTLAKVISDAGIRLAGHDHFPWDEAARVLATLDLPLALAATARWDDSAIADRETFLPPVLTVALLQQTLTPEQVTACLNLLDHLDEPLLDLLIAEAHRQQAAQDKSTLWEEMARHEVLHFGRGYRPRIIDKLMGMSNRLERGYWRGQLARATAFHQLDRPEKCPLGHTAAFTYGDRDGSDHSDPLICANLTAHRFITPDEILAAIEGVSTAAKAAGMYVSTTDIITRIGAAVAVGDRAAYCEALCRCVPTISEYQLANVLAQCILTWPATPAVTQWCRERLLSVIADCLPGFSGLLDSYTLSLYDFLAKTRLGDQQLCEQLLAAMERHVGSLDSRTVYQLIGVICRYCTHNDAAAILTRYTERIAARLPVADQELWLCDDLPIDATDGLARLLYSLMSDIDVRVRWRAAHALRSLARLGAPEVIDRAVALYDRTTELCYRAPHAPFYWLAARLWLVIAIDRITDEAPSAVLPHALWLCQVANDESFPHVLIRAFAKSAVMKLVDTGQVRFNADQVSTLMQANTSTERRPRVRDSYLVGGFDLRAREARRFHFDSMDTLPYWYSSILRTFVDVTGQEFLDVAEHWIIDRWGVHDDPWRWGDEPRQDRFSGRRSLLSMHGHGSLPVFERFSTYLEWHAMWCTTGELMRQRALAMGDADAYDTLDARLAANGLSAPPMWLADLHGPKPLEEPLWFPPRCPIDQWCAVVDDGDFLAEVGLNGDTDTIIVGSSHDTRSCQFSATVRVNTALVSPDTASALVRALQTVEDPWVYRIPAAGDDVEINIGPYSLIGWLSDSHHDMRIDEHDPLRYEVRQIECHPSDQTRSTLHLDFIPDYPPRWVTGADARTVFTYDTWGDTRGDEQEDRYRGEQAVRSTGWRLRIEREALRTFLNESGCDLIIEVEIRRRNYGYDSYVRFDEEKNQETRFDRLLLLRRDGTLEAAEGCIGTWALPCAGIGTGG